MLGILIDPFAKTVTQVETTGGIDEIYSFLKCELFTVVNLDDRNCVFLDDEGLFVPKEEQEYWSISGANQPYAGRGLILGTDADGDTAGASIPLEKIKSMVTFLDKEEINPDQYLGHKFFILEDGEWKEI